MPLPIAHSLISTTVYVAYRGSLSPRRDIPWIGLFILVGLLPDLDIILTPIAGIAFHRGISHSLLFALVSSTLIFLTVRYTKGNVSKRLWLYLCITALLHPLCDYFTPDYLEVRRGVQLFYPFSLRYYESPYPLFMGIELRYFETIFSTHTVLALMHETFVTGTIFLTTLYIRDREFRTVVHSILRR